MGEETTCLDEVRSGHLYYMKAREQRAQCKKSRSLLVIDDYTLNIYTRT
jgi:hypothetical protein